MESYSYRYQSFSIKLAKKLNYQIKDLIVSREDNRPIAIG